MIDDERSTILIVEDDDATRCFLGDNLTADGHEVLVADSGRDGLRMLEYKYPDLAVVDLALPDIDAYDAFYKRLISAAPLQDVSSSFAMEQIKFTTALPI